MDNQLGNATEEEILNFYQNISKTIRNIREEKGISQLDLALEIGIKSVAFYSNCECCRLCGSRCDAGSDISRS